MGKWKWASGKHRNWNKRWALFDGTTKKHAIPVKGNVFWSICEFRWVLVAAGILIAVVWWMV